MSIRLNFLYRVDPWTQDRKGHTIRQTQCKPRFIRVIRLNYLTVNQVVRSRNNETKKNLSELRLIPIGLAHIRD